MTSQFDIWQFVGGIGLFLFAMVQLETALGGFARRPLKRFLQKHTDKALKSVLVGAVSTAIVQSSSLVGLMVLAFVGASIMSLTNALGVIFGANLGTTLTGWAVATLGFKLNLESISLPLIGVGSLLLVGLKGRVSEFGRMLTAVGLLLMGISLMKSSVGTVADTLDVTRLADLAGWQYLSFGIVFAAIVQSSSAAMMVTLAALHSGVIELPAAAAIAIGADLGTTSTIVIGALQGASGKKRVALAHFIFNLVTAIFAFSLLLPLLNVVRGAGILDPLFSLVAFHSLFNLVGIIVFLPIMRPFAHFLERRFAGTVRHESLFVCETTATVSDAAIVAIAEETAHIIGRVIRQNMRVFTPALPTPAGRFPVKLPAEPGTDKNASYDELYRRNKLLEGEILSFALKVQAEPLEPEQAERLNRLLSSIRQVVHSAKSLRDVRHNFEEFSDSANGQLIAYLEHFRSAMTEFYGAVFRLRTGVDSQAIFQDFIDLMKKAHGAYDQMHREVYKGIHHGQLADDEISSLLNVNRELLNSNIALVVALEEFGSKEGDTAVFDQLPE